jgi:porin
MLRNAFHFTLILPTIAAAAFGLSAGHAVAKDADTEKLLTWQADYVADGSGVVQGPITGTRYTGYASLAADASLEKSFGWQGAHVFLHGIASTGGRPNDLAGTLQGINNIEVENNRAKLYELYFEQHFGNGNQTFRLGFSDLNSEFYATDSRHYFWLQPLASVLNWLRQAPMAQQFSPQPH